MPTMRNDTDWSACVVALFTASVNHHIRCFQKEIQIVLEVFFTSV
jgi:hypothetical protein